MPLSAALDASAASLSVAQPLPSSHRPTASTPTGSKSPFFLPRPPSNYLLLSAESQAEPLLVDFIFVRSDGAQPHLVNIQFQKKVQLQVSALSHRAAPARFGLDGAWSFFCF